MILLQDTIYSSRNIKYIRNYCKLVWRDNLGINFQPHAVPTCHVKKSEEVVTKPICIGVIQLPFPHNVCLEEF